MKLRPLALLAVISYALAALPAGSARRPRYGGVLRVEIAGAIDSLDPAASPPKAELASEKLSIESLIYDRRDPRIAISNASAPGPFRVSEWLPGKHATLVASDDYSGGRPFVDAIEIQMDRSAKDRLLDLELNKTDLAELPAEQARRAAERGVRVSASQPQQLIALAFVPGSTVAEDARVREALSHAIDRPSIVNFLLQKEGEPAGCLLPQWLSGAAFLFPAASDPAAAKEQWSAISGSPKIVLGYDSADELEQSIAERIVVNARESGIPLAALAFPNRQSPQAKVDARLVRADMSSPHSREALAGLLKQLSSIPGIDTAPLPDPASPQQIYERERAIVGAYRIVPIAWVPKVYGLSSSVRDWKAPGPGSEWPLADVWLDGSNDLASPK